MGFVGRGLTGFAMGPVAVGFIAPLPGCDQWGGQSGSVV